MNPGTVVDARELSRFELNEDGGTSFADYERRDGVLIIRHVESPPALRGKGTAGRLMAGVCEAARRADEKILPLCAYAAAYIRRRADAGDLLA